MKYIRIGDYFRIIKGKKVTPLENITEHSIRYIQIDDLRNNNNIKYCERSKEYVIANHKDIIIAWDGANAGTINYGLEGAIGSTLAVLRTDDDIYIPYVGKYLQTKFQYLRDNCTGATIPHIQRNSLESIEVPIFSIKAQKKIAQVLDKAQELINKRKEQIEKLDEFIQSVFIDMFGDYDRWPMRKVEDIASEEKYSLSSGPFGSSLTSKHYTNNGVIVLRGLNISKGKLDLSDIKYVSEEKAIELKRSEIKPNDLVIVAVGASGRALKVTEVLPRAIMSQNFNKVTPDMEIVNTAYLEFCFNSIFVQSQIKKLITDTVRTFLSLTNIKDLIIPVPPISLQNEFNIVVQKTEQQKELLQKGLAELENNFNSLMQRAFRGELFN